MSNKVITKETITLFLRNLLINEKKIDPALLLPNNELKLLGIDSFSFLEIVFNIEHEFNITFPQEFGDLTTLQDVVDFTFELVLTKQNSATV